MSDSSLLSIDDSSPHFVTVRAESWNLLMQYEAQVASAHPTTLVGAYRGQADARWPLESRLSRVVRAAGGDETVALATENDLLAYLDAHGVLLRGDDAAAEARHTPYHAQAPVCFRLPGLTTGCPSAQSGHSSAE